MLNSFRSYFIRHLSFTLFLFVFSQTQANNGVKLRLKSGQEITFMFSHEPCLVMGKELLVKTRDGNEIYYEYSEVRNIRITGEQDTNIESKEIIGDSNLTFKLIAGLLSISGLPVGEYINVSSTNSKQCKLCI